MTRSQLIQACRKLGMSCRYDVGTREYRINVKGGKEATAYYTDSATDALATAEAMAKHVANNTSLLLVKAYEQAIAPLPDMLGCGCCRGPESDRCCCHIHQDISRGDRAKTCSRHTVVKA